MTQSSMKLAAALALAVAPSLATAATVKVGVVLTYSGSGAQLAQQIERGMELYLAREGNAKLGEHEIELIKRDDKNPGGDAAKVAVQELIVREDVDLLTGFIYSPNIIASAPLIEQAKVPTLIMNAATAWIPSLSPLSRPRLHEHVADRLSRWDATPPRSSAARTAAVGYTDYPPGKDSLAAFQMGFEQAGGQVVDAIPMGGPAEVPDFTPFMQRVKDARPDCFYVFVPAGNHAARGVQDLRRSRHADAGVRLIGPGDITQDTELQGLGDVAIGVVTLGPVPGRPGRRHEPRVRRGLEARRTAPDSTPDFMAAAGYDGMAAIVDAIVEQDGEIDPDRTMAIWAGWSHEGPRGTVTIDPETRDIVQDMRVNEVYAEDGRLQDAHARRDPAGQGPVQGAEGRPLRRVIAGGWTAAPEVSRERRRPSCSGRSAPPHRRLSAVPGPACRREARRGRPAEKRADERRRAGPSGRRPPGIALSPDAAPRQRGRLRGVRAAPLQSDAPRGLLRSDVPGSLRVRAIYDCDEAYWQAWGNLMHSVATGEPAFDRTHGVPFFEYMKTHAAIAANFNTVMTDQNAAAAQAVVEAYDFSGLGTLVDVGGGHGSLLAAILAAHPLLRGILHDQPHVVATARPTLEAAGVADRCDIIGGDFFEARARGRRCLPPEAHPPQLGRAALRGDPQERPRCDAGGRPAPGGRNPHPPGRRAELWQVSRPRHARAAAGTRTHRGGI